MYSPKITHAQTIARICAHTYTGTEKYILRSDVMYHRQDPICTQPQDLEAYELYRRAIDLAGERGREAEALPLFQRAFRISPGLADVYGM